MKRTLIVLIAICCFTYVAEAQKQKDINEALQIEIQSLQRKVDSLERIYWKNEAKIATLESTIDKLSSFFSEQTNALVKKLGELTANNQVAEKPYEIVGNYGSSYDNTYHADRLLVRHGAYFGFIDRSEHIAIPCIYDEAWAFYDNGFAWIKKNGKWGIINTDGEEVITTQYDEVWESVRRPQTHQFIVIKDWKYGVIDVSGKVILKTIYAYIRFNYDHYDVDDASGKSWNYNTEGQRL